MSRTKPIEMRESLPKLENAAGEVAIGTFRFPRLALGAMRLLASDTPSAECFADPIDPETNRALMRAAVSEAGIRYIDFARGYGATPDSGEGWFREWMSPYPEDLLWATKIGYQRDDKGSWHLNLDPEFLREEISKSLDILGSPLLLCYLTAGSTRDVTVHNRPSRIAESFRPLLQAYERGEVQHLGVANVTASELSQLLEFAPLSVVQNKFTVASLSEPAQRDVLDLCLERHLPFVAWGVFSSDDDGPWIPSATLVQTAQELEVSPQDLSISVLLQAAPNLVVLTGASRHASLAASIRAANRRLPHQISERFQPT